MAGRHRAGRAAALALATALAVAGCSSLWPGRSGSRPGAAPAPAHGAASPAGTSSPTAPSLPLPEGAVQRPRAAWLPAAFGELPGWGSDRAQEVWPALRQSCTRPASGWATFCSQLATFQPSDAVSARRWLEDRMRVFRVETLQGEATGLLTGYYEPFLDGSRRPQANRRVPLWALPADLAERKPYWTRQELDTLPQAQASVQGREIAWLEDPLDALVLQIQGSGRMRITEPDGSQRLIRLAFAGHNQQPYRSVGRWLVDQGELSLSEASWPAIKDWARRNPRRVSEMLWQNPRMVFFREEALTDPNLGPKGAQGVPLTPGRSVAVDPQSVPYGSLMWLDATEPLSERPLQRLVVAQDTGSAIVGAVRADYFWGWGEEAGAQAGRMKQPLRVWVLWPLVDWP